MQICVKLLLYQTFGHSTTIYQIDCQEGYLTSVFLQINKIIAKEHSADCILSLDEMSIRKGVVWDPLLKTYGGFTTVLPGVGNHQKQ